MYVSCPIEYSAPCMSLSTADLPAALPYEYFFYPFVRSTLIVTFSIRLVASLLAHCSAAWILLPRATALHVRIYGMISGTFWLLR